MMNTYEQVKLDTKLTEVGGEIASLKERMTRLENAQPKQNNHPADCICDGCMKVVSAYEIQYYTKSTGIVDRVFLVYRVEELIDFVNNAPAGRNIEIRPLTKDDLVRGEEDI